MTAPDLQTVAEPEDALAETPVPEPAPDQEPEPVAEAEAQPESSEPPEPREPKGPGPGEDLSDEELERALSALLFASPEPLSRERLVKLLERPVPTRVDEAVERLRARFVEAGLPFVVEEIAGGWRILTAPDTLEVVQRLTKVRGAEKVTPAALETLAIVAYRQPVTNAEVEAIRGVQSGAMLRALVDRGLVRVTGRADQPGSPLQYGTTKEFLDRFGLKDLKELPRDGELAGDR